MDYKHYIMSRDAAWQMLIDAEVNALPVDIIGICKNMGIVVKYYAGEDGSDGKSTIIDNIPYILVAKGRSVARKRFTVAHELGHIILGHVGKYELVNREPSGNDNEIETQANMFAARLLAPVCVLWGCKVTTAEEISQMCCISKQASDFRMERMRELYKRNKFLNSRLERQVFEQFQEYIKNHQHRAN